MAKFCGIIGYAVRVEAEPGVWIDEIVERPYFGDLIKNYNRHESSGGVNDNIKVTNKISIVSDPYASDHVYEMSYVKFKIPQLGGTWKISDAEIEYPRILLTLGGVYHGE